MGVGTEADKTAEARVEEERERSLYWDFREKVENLVFDPIRRGGRVEAEILSELNNMRTIVDDACRPQEITDVKVEEEMIEDGCRGMYGKNWDGPDGKRPGEAMKNVWRIYARECLEGALMRKFKT